MNDFAQIGGSDEEFANVRKHQAEVDVDPDKFEHWEQLIAACESLEGGLSRNSSPQALAACRDTYDRFLAKFPLYFGYWKKYAEFEFNIAGTESAEMVYERGTAANPHSVDLWAEYCRFKMDTTHNPEIVRSLFEHAASYVGTDFMSQPFWDKYLEYEERQEAQDRVLALLVRIVRLPLQHLSLYFDRLRNLTHKLPVSELVAADVLTRFQAEVAAESAASGGGNRTELEVERDIRAKIDNMYYEIQMATATEVNKRWNPELALGHQFFHTVELSHEQLNAWRKYLDLEEAEGNYRRIQCLYERCVVVCAMYDEFWFRYVRWMSSQAGKEEELRSIFIRAAFFVPVSRPGIRLQWAYFEESCGRIGIAQDIHSAILTKLPDCIEVIVSWAHLQRRQEGLEAAVQVLKDQIDAPTVDLYTKAALVAEWAMMLWKFKSSAEQARAVFLKNAQWYGDSRTFWERWFQFELEQPTTIEDGDSEIAQRVKHVFDEFRSKSRLSATVKQQLAHIYLDFLIRLGGKGSMREYLTIDREMFGPSCVAAVSKGQEGVGENGAPEQLDESRRKKAEAPLVFFFETFTDPNPAATGPADYH